MTCLAVPGETETSPALAGETGACPPAAGKTYCHVAGKNPFFVLRSRSAGGRSFAGRSCCFVASAADSGMIAGSAGC